MRVRLIPWWCSLVWGFAPARLNDALPNRTVRWWGITAGSWFIGATRIRRELQADGPTASKTSSDESKVMPTAALEANARREVARRIAERARELGATHRQGSYGARTALNDLADWIDSKWNEDDEGES